MSDDTDELEQALRASGWTEVANQTLLSAEDEQIAALILGKTNARRLRETPRGRRARLVRTKEVYAVENSRGWIVGAIEGHRNKVLGRGLSADRRDTALAVARERGFHIVIHDNPGVRSNREPEPRRRDEPYWYPSEKPATPSAHAAPSRRHALIRRLGRFKT
jgi:hypothetical protein